MRWVIISSLVVLGLADLMVLNLVAIPRYRDSLRGAGGDVAEVTEPAQPQEPEPNDLPDVETATEPETAADPEAGLEPGAPAVEEPTAEPETQDPLPAEPELPAEPQTPPSPTVTQPTNTASAPPLEPAYFATGSAGVLSYVREHLRHAVVVMRRDPSLRVLLRGHSDRRGLDENNLGLSRSRAEAVADYLVSQGIPRQRIDVEWVGESQPANTGDTLEDRAKNRRVELIWR